MTSPHNFLLSYRNFLSVAGQLGAADNRKLAVFGVSHCSNTEFLTFLSILPGDYENAVHKTFIGTEFLIGLTPSR